MTGRPKPTAEDDAIASEAGAGEERGSVFRRLRQKLSRTRTALVGELRASVTEPVGERTWERLEEALIYADAGARTTAEIVGRLEDEVHEGTVPDGTVLLDRLREMIAETVRSDDELIDVSHAPSVILVVGVNGSGKTTTIGKIAWHLKNEVGCSVLLAAADTFRAAAQEQLAVWADRVGCDIVQAQPGSDPGAVVFDAIEAARSRDQDVVIADTAGRLHTQVGLMEELAKVRRVIQRQISDAPHETLLTIDATTGQNGLRQAQLFQEAVGVTGVCLTKLDGTARGGIALAVSHELGIPVKLIGIGEAMEDLRPFDSDEFASALVE